MLLHSSPFLPRIRNAIAGAGLLRSTATAETIAANQHFVGIVDSSGDLYLAPEGGSTTWTKATSPGAYFATTIGSLGMGADLSMSVLGPSGAVQISHDAGTTWSTIGRGGIGASAVANGFASASFMLASTGKVYHLNTFLPYLGMSVSGTCGSVCGSGNPQITVGYHNADTNAQYVCPTSPWIYWTMGGIDCGFLSYANTSLNTVLANTLVTDCDYYQPGNCGPANDGKVETKIEIVLTVAGTVVYDSVQECDPCGFVNRLFNQKYKITSSRTGTPTKVDMAHTGPGEFYEWSNVSSSQWCVSAVSPTLLPTGASILYGPVTTQPTAMPGQYINGDVPGFQYPDGTVTGVPGVNVIANYTDGGPGMGSAQIYTWDGTSALRGTGGDPTTPCQGGLPN
jgi:hypothetical protein